MSAEILPFSIRGYGTRAAALRAIVIDLWNHDAGVALHSLATGVLAAQLVRAVGDKRVDAEIAQWLGYLHDAASLELPAETLNDPYDPEHYATIVATRAAPPAALLRFPDLADDAQRVYAYNAGADALLFRIVRVADTYDSLIRPWPYRPACDASRALAITKRVLGEDALVQVLARVLRNASASPVA